jgi:hypothetical protein
MCELLGLNFNEPVRCGFHSGGFAIGVKATLMAGVLADILAKML